MGLTVYIYIYICVTNVNLYCGVYASQMSNCFAAFMRHKSQTVLRRLCVTNVKLFCGVDASLGTFVSKVHDSLRLL